MIIVVILFLSLYLIPAPSSIAASLEKYYEPAQRKAVPREAPKTRKKSIYKKSEKSFSAPDLEKEIRVDMILRSLEPAEREKWLQRYKKRMINAFENNRMDEALYYKEILQRWGKIK